MECQTSLLGKTGKVWQGRIMQLIRITLEARIVKQEEKQVQRTVRYQNHEDKLRWESGCDTELDELEAAE